MSETQAIEVRYIVRRRFKYGKLHLKPGDAFVPQGGRFDDAILHSNLVTLETDAYRHKSRVGVRRRNAHAKIGAKAAQRATPRVVDAAPMSAPEKETLPVVDEIEVIDDAPEKAPARGGRKSSRKAVE